MATVSIERCSPFLFMKKKKTILQEPKKFYSCTKNFILNQHPGLISESTRYHFYRVHGVKIGTKSGKRENFYEKSQFLIQVARNLLKQWARIQWRCAEVESRVLQQVETSSYQQKFVP